MKPTSCPRGHRFTPSNTYRSANNTRRCRQCRADRDRAAYTRTTPLMRHVSLARARTALGWSQSQLATAAGISRPHLARVEIGTARLGVKALERVFAAFAKGIEAGKVAA